MEHWYLQRVCFEDVYLLLKQTVKVGRAEDLDLKCEDTKVSRRHCELFYANGHWNVKDYESMNGVFINRKKVAKGGFAELKNGDTIGFGVVEPSDGYVYRLRCQSNEVKIEANCVKQEPAAPSMSTNAPVIDIVDSDSDDDNRKSEVKLKLKLHTKEPPRIPERRNSESDLFASDEEAPRPLKKAKRMIISESEDSADEAPAKEKPKAFDAAVTLKAFGLKDCRVRIRRLTPREICKATRSVKAQKEKTASRDSDRSSSKSSSKRVKGTNSSTKKKTGKSLSPRAGQSKQGPKEATAPLSSTSKDKEWKIKENLPQEKLILRLASVPRGEQEPATVAAEPVRPTSAAEKVISAPESSKNKGKQWKNGEKSRFSKSSRSESAPESLKGRSEEDDRTVDEPLIKRPRLEGSTSAFGAFENGAVSPVKVKTEIPTLLVKPQVRDAAASEPAAPMVAVYSQLDELDEEPNLDVNPEAGHSPEADSDDDIFVMDEFIVHHSEKVKVKDEPVDEHDDDQKDLDEWFQILSQDYLPKVKVEKDDTARQCFSELVPAPVPASISTTYDTSVQAPIPAPLPAPIPAPLPATVPASIPAPVPASVPVPVKADEQAPAEVDGPTLTEEDEQWWPDLSQRFFEEEEQDSRQQQQQQPLPGSTSHTSRRVAHQPVSKTKPIDALPLGGSSLHRRLTTAGGASAFAVPFPSRPARRRSSGERTSTVRRPKKSDIREKLKKDHGLTGYAASVKAGVTSTSDLAVLTTKPKAVPGARAPPAVSKKPATSTSSAAVSEAANLMLPPAAAPVKAKVTAKNRSSFLADMAAAATTAKKQQPAPAPAKFKIPKKSSSPTAAETPTTAPVSSEKTAASPGTSRLIAAATPILKTAAAPPAALVLRRPPTESTAAAFPGVPQPSTSRRADVNERSFDEPARPSTSKTVRFASQHQEVVIPSVVSATRKGHQYPKDVPRNARPVTDPLHHSICSRDDTLLRILHWSPSWLEEQKGIQEPPPLLEKNSDVSVGLKLLPVVGQFDSAAAYMSIFLPLILHEMWAELTREYDAPARRLLLQPHKVESSGKFSLLHCLGVPTMDHVSFSLMDLVQLDLRDDQNRPVSLFGYLEKLERVHGTPKLDPRLQQHAKDRPIFDLTFRMRRRNLGPLTVIPARVLGTARNALRYAKTMKHHLLDSSLRDLILKPTLDNFQLKRLDELGASQLAPAVSHMTLNDSQLEAVLSVTDAVLSRPQEPKICLLQGPPGTGKSHTIVTLVLNLLLQSRHENPKILICAPSNAAIDEIVYRLKMEKNNSRHLQNFSMVRVGVPGSVNRLVKSCCIDTITEQFLEKQLRDMPVGSFHADSDAMVAVLNEERELSRKCGELKKLVDSLNATNRQDLARVQERKLEELKRHHRDALMALNEARRISPKERDRMKMEIKWNVLKRANIVASTLNSAVSNYMERHYSKEKTRFLCCIIDEASQCTEPESLLPLAYKVNKLVLIGDPEQLPATVQSQVAEKKHFNRSLFTRLHEHLRVPPNFESPGLMLDTQYRMHAEICAWPSKYFYGNTLKTPSVLQRESPLCPYKVLNFLEGREETSGRETSNPREASLISDLIAALWNYEPIKGKSIGVITFYRKQKQLLENSIRKKCPSASSLVQVHTVDGFQGQEKDIILLSCVRTDLNNVGFVAHLQRLNVSLTRARYCLVICGSLSALSKCPGWAELVEDAYSRNVVTAVTTAFDTDLLLKRILRDGSDYGTLI